MIPLNGNIYLKLSQEWYGSKSKTNSPLKSRHFQHYLKMLYYASLSNFISLVAKICWIGDGGRTSNVAILELYFRSVLPTSHNFGDIFRRLIKKLSSLAKSWKYFRHLLIRTYMLQYFIPI